MNSLKNEERMNLLSILFILIFSSCIASDDSVLMEDFLAFAQDNCIPQAKALVWLNARKEARKTFRNITLENDRLKPIEPVSFDTSRLKQVIEKTRPSKESYHPVHSTSSRRSVEQREQRQKPKEVTDAETSQRKFDLEPNSFASVKKNEPNFISPSAAPVAIAKQCEPNFIVPSITKEKLAVLDHKEQNVWFLNAFWSNMSEQSSENARMSEQERKEAELFLQKYDEAQAVSEMRAILRERKDPDASGYCEIVSKPYLPEHSFGTRFWHTLLREHNLDSTSIIAPSVTSAPIIRSQSKQSGGSMDVVLSGLDKIVDKIEPIEHRTIYDDFLWVYKRAKKDLMPKKLREYERLACLNRAASRWKSMAQEYKPCSMKNEKSMLKKSNVYHLNQPKKMKKG